jgi:hypothetical protein
MACAGLLRLPAAGVAEHGRKSDHQADQQVHSFTSKAKDCLAKMNRLLEAIALDLGVDVSLAIQG